VKILSKVRAISRTVVSIAVVLVIVVAAAGSYYFYTQPQPTTTTTQTKATASQTTQLGFTIKIGASLPLTGGSASFGQDNLIAYQRFQDQINAQGGIFLSSLNGYAKVQLVYYDDTSDPTVTTSNIQRLVSQDKVVALLGGWTTPLITAAARVAQSAQIPFVGVGSADPVFDTGNYTWSFINYGNLTMQSVPMEYLASLPASQRPSKVAIWADTTSLGVLSTADWKLNAAKLGFQVVYTASYQTGEKDFSSIILATKQAGAEIVFSIPVPTDAVTMVTQMNDLKYSPALISLQRGAETSYFASTAGTLSNGVVFAVDWAPTMTTTGSKEFVQFYQNKTGHLPGSNPGQAYATFQILAGAIQKAGTLDNKALQQALATGRFDTVLGVKFFPKGFGHANRSTWMVEQWQNGVLQVIWPSDQASAKPIYPRP
jgi:branched-chain amino acid transport system substrate-binding protein